MKHSHEHNHHHGNFDKDSVAHDLHRHEHHKRTHNHLHTRHKHLEDKIVQKNKQRMTFNEKYFPRQYFHRVDRTSEIHQNREHIFKRNQVQNSHVPHPQSVLRVPQPRLDRFTKPNYIANRNGHQYPNSFHKITPQYSNNQLMQSVNRGQQMHHRVPDFSNGPFMQNKPPPQQFQILPERQPTYIEENVPHMGQPDTAPQKLNPIPILWRQVHEPRQYQEPQNPQRQFGNRNLGLILPQAHLPLPVQNRFQNQKTDLL